ncbi:MAG: hypothetical protein M1495_15475 [Bacteroidetes bacterium]|nr:hypothetical protein [Bacteroidota bacterium]
MKRLFSFEIILFTLVAFNSQVKYAQANDENTVKSTLKNLLEFSKTKAYDKAASLIAYEGDDKNRIHKDSFNPSNKEELNQVKRICKKITALLELSSKYEFGDFKSSDSGVYTMQVVFISGEQKLATTFNFEKTGKGFLLVSMN